MFRGALSLLCLALLGCAGPIVANSTIFRAQGVMAQAEAAGAQEKALYQYTLGTHLLHKAWEEQAHSSYQTSQDLAEQAERAFNEALRQCTALGDGKEELPDSVPAETNDSNDGDWGQDSE